MKDCEQLIQKIKSGEKGVKEAMEEMYRNVDFQKSAYYWYNRYPALANTFGGKDGWEDIFVESILRFVNSALSKQKLIGNCRAFFYAICKNVVKELYRKLPPKGDLPKDFRPDELFKALLPYLEKLPPQCQLLLFLIYFHQPPYDSKDKNAIADLLKAEGYDLKPENIPATITRCKQKLKKLIREDLENFEGFEWL